MAENPTDKRGMGALADYAPLIQAADGLTLGQICAVSGLGPSTVQNWIKRGFVSHPIRKKYNSRHLARILLISRLRETMQIDRVGELLRYINGDADDTSDDIISEEELFDMFVMMTAELESCMPPPDKAGEVAARIASEHVSDEESRLKLTNALSVMACTYIANLYKRKAEQIFKDL